MAKKKQKIDPDGIRKAFFGGTLSAFFADLLAEGKVTDDDIKEVGVELERLRGEEQDFAGKLRNVYDGPIPGTENKPPSVDELFEGVSDKEWREKADKAAAYIEETLDKVRLAVAEKKAVVPTFWLDQANVFLSMLNIIDKDMVFKDQLYRARMTRIIDDFGISRKEAEERARITPEYAGYKNASLLHDRVMEFVMMAKKKDAENRHY